MSRRLRHASTPPHPLLRAAVPADARITAALRGERYEFRSRWDTALQILRLAAVSDAFLGQVLYRTKARLQRLRIPLLPRVAHGLAVSSTGISIGDRALVHPGVYIVHGQVVIDGPVEIHRGAVISPEVLIDGERGSTGTTIGPGASIGTGAKILGPVRVGAKARIGANAVVIEDVPAGATAVGVPAGAAGGAGEG